MGSIFSTSISRFGRFSVLAILAVAASGCLSGRQEPTATEVIETAEGEKVAVNRYLWNAALETLGFMPLAFADPFSGVLATEWYANPEAPAERFKATVYILDKRLRADGLRVTVHRQQLSPDAGWVDAAVNPNTSVEIENAILTRARELRLNSLGE